MNESMTYLKIGGTVFGGGLLPDMIMPKIELINNAERSLDGTMNIDIIARKINLEITWSVVSAENMTKISQIGNNVGTFEVTYISPDSSAEKKIVAYAEDLAATPFFMGKELKWKDVTLTLVEV